MRGKVEDDGMAGSSEIRKQKQKSGWGIILEIHDTTDKVLQSKAHFSDHQCRMMYSVREQLLLLSEAMCLLCVSILYLVEPERIESCHILQGNGP